MIGAWNRLKIMLKKYLKVRQRLYPGKIYLIAAGILSILLYVLSRITATFPDLSICFIASFAIAMIIGFYLFKHGYIDYLKIFISMTCWLLISLFGLVRGSIEAPGMAAFVLVIFYVGIVVNPFMGYVITGLSIFFTLIIYFLEIYGALSFSFATTKDSMVVYLGIYFGAGMLIYIAKKNLHSTISQVSETEKRYHALFDRSNDGVFITDFDGEILAVNNRGASILGYTVDELVGLAFRHIIPSEEQIVADSKLLNLLNGGIVPIYERKFVHKSGMLIPFEVNLTMISDENGTPLNLQSLVRNISDRKRVELSQEELLAELQETKGSLQLLSRQLVEVQENERRFIARELHDEIGQTLTGLQFLLETVNKDRADDTSTERLNRAKVLLNELMQRVRQLSLDLRPAMLDDFGLIPALEWLFERYASQTAIEVIYDHANVEHKRFDLEVETAMYRLVQEALNNVAKHADIKYVYVYVKEKEGLLIATVKDTGKGIDFNELGDAINQTAGIIGMKERVALLNGSVKIHSKKDQGTTVVASIPVEIVAEAE